MFVLSCYCLSGLNIHITGFHVVVVQPRPLVPKKYTTLYGYGSVAWKDWMEDWKKKQSQVYKLSIGAACGLSWPSDRIIIQVFDDSKDAAIKVINL